jgi:long-chain acyl-CoA synthetase
VAPDRPEEDAKGGVVLPESGTDADSAPSVNPFSYLERNGSANPSGVFVESTDQKVLNSDAVVSVKKIAFELRRLGVKPGDLLALDLPDLLQLLFTEAAFHEGAATTVLPANFVADGSFPIDWIFSTTGRDLGTGSQTVTVDTRFIDQIEQNPYGTIPREFESDASLLRVVFSSGTTGRPNPIALTVGMLAAHSFNALDTWMQGNPFLVLLGTGTAMGFNAFFLSVQDNRPFLSISTAEPRAIVDLADRNSVTSLKASPAQVAGIAGELEAQGRTLPSIASIYIVGSVLSPAVASRIRATLEGCEICNLYGSTEATIAFARYYDSDDPHDAGQPFPGSTVEIVDEEDQPVPTGEIGRIRHRHPQMIHEYLGNPEATRQSFNDGWFYPGDLGLIRPDGGLTLAGRASEILNAGGVKVDPALLDLFAMSSPGIRDACSFSYEAASGVQQVGIALVTDDDLDVEALIHQFQARFGAAAPQLVGRVSEIPRNAMGKPMRNELAERYRGN